jgi:hypothetical protein
LEKFGIDHILDKLKRFFGLALLLFAVISYAIRIDWQFSNLNPIEPNKLKMVITVTSLKAFDCPDGFNLDKRSN